jgi:hypothetical protein
MTGHDTIGPVALSAATHLMLHIPNALITETVRGYVDGWYDEVVTYRIPLAEGHLSVPDRPYRLSAGGASVPSPVVTRCPKSRRGGGLASILRAEARRDRQPKSDP